MMTTGPLVLATSLLVLLAGCNGHVVASANSSPTDASPAGTPAPLPAGDGCRVPILPSPGSYAGYALSGPAVGSLRGGPATRAFNVDAGSLQVDPPRPGDHPTVSAGAAECAMLASLDAFGFSLGRLASSSGLAIGLGRVTLRGDLLAGAFSSPPNLTCGGCPHPKLPPASAYVDRLSWVAAVGRPGTVSCPLQAAGSPLPTPARLSTDYGYEVFLLDAVTGMGALVYGEGGPVPCGGNGRSAPTVQVPKEQVSVPWTLTARDPGGYAGTVSAEVLPCDGYLPVVLVDRGQPNVQVIVQRPVGATCGSPTAVAMPLRAATVTSVLPPSIGHDPTGLYLETVVP